MPFVTATVQKPNKEPKSLIYCYSFTVS